jgi:hypothetical protein
LKKKSFAKRLNKLNSIKSVNSENYYIKRAHKVYVLLTLNVLGFWNDKTPNARKRYKK